MLTLLSISCETWLLDFLFCFVNVEVLFILLALEGDPEVIRQYESGHKVIGVKTYLVKVFGVKCS